MVQLDRPLPPCTPWPSCKSTRPRRSSSCTKVTARALGQTISTLVVQERHLWLTLADMRESDKHRFLDSPISQAGLFGEAVEDFAQQFSAAQKQTETFCYILPRRSAAVSTLPPTAAPPSARRRGRPYATFSSAPARPQQQPSQRPQCGAGRSKAAQPASISAKPVKRQGRRRPWDGRPRASGSCSSRDGDRTTPSPREGTGGESFVSFLFCSTTGPQNFKKRAVSFSSGSQEGEDGSAWDPVSTLPSPSPFASGQQGPVRGRNALSCTPCPAMEPGECRTTYSDPTSRRTAFRVGPLCSTSLPHRGYVGDSPGPAYTVSGGLVRVPQAVLMAPEDHQTRLRDSVRPASSQVQGHSVHLSVEQGCPCLVCRSRGPAGEGRDRAGPSSRDEIRVLQPLLHRTQERRWVTTNLGPTHSEPGPSQAPVQDVDAETHLSMHPSFRLVFSNWPEGHLVSLLPQHRPFLRFAFEGWAYQYKALPFGLSLSPRVFTKVVEAARVPLREAGIRVLNYLDDWLLLAQSRTLLCEHRDTVLSHLSRLGLQVYWEKSKLSPTQRISFLGMELDSVNLTARLSIELAQSMLSCLESFQRKRAVPLKHFQRLLGHMVSAATVTPHGLLHMILLQR